MRNLAYESDVKNLSVSKRDLGATVGITASWHNSLPASGPV